MILWIVARRVVSASQIYDQYGDGFYPPLLEKATLSQHDCDHQCGMWVRRARARPPEKMDVQTLLVQTCTLTQKTPTLQLLNHSRKVARRRKCHGADVLSDFTPTCNAPRQDSSLVVLCVPTFSDVSHENVTHYMQPPA